MPTPTERLAAKKQSDCRVCSWLSTLTTAEQSEWQEAIHNPRFGAALVANEINLEITATSYDGLAPGENSVKTHRRRGHR